MLHARLEVAQILDHFQVRMVIHEFAPGTDPVIWESAPVTVEMPKDLEHSDALSTTMRLIQIWSEMTNSA